jgi:hypothetical protein
VTLTRPGIFASPQASDALEEALLRPMIMCLQHGMGCKESKPRGRRAAMARRFAAVVEANFDRPCCLGNLSDHWRVGADAAQHLPGAVGHVATAVPGATATASGATGAAAVRPVLRDGYRDRNESRGPGTRAICRGLQVVVRGIAIGYTSPIVLHVAGTVTFPLESGPKLHSSASPSHIQRGPRGRTGSPEGTVQ